jgi:hypothetical protein
MFLSCTWSPEVPEPGLVDYDDVLQVDEEKLALLVHSKVAGGPVYNSRKLIQTLVVYSSVAESDPRHGSGSISQRNGSGSNSKNSKTFISAVCDFFLTF